MTLTQTLCAGVLLACVAAASYISRRSTATDGVLLALGVALVMSGPAAPTALRQFSYAFMIVFLLLAVLSRRPRIQYGLPVIVLAVLLLVISVSTQIGSPSNIATGMSLYLIVWLSFVVGTTFGAVEFAQFARGLIVLCVIQSLLIAREMGGEPPLPWGRATKADVGELVYEQTFLPFGFFRVEGMIGHPLPLGAFILLALILLLAGWGASKPMYRLVLSLPLIVSFVAAGSRSQAGVAIILLVIGAVGLARGRWRFFSATWILGCVFAAGWLVWPSLNSTIDSLNASGSFTNRAGAASSIPGLLQRTGLEFWIGSGFGSEVGLRTRGLLQQNDFGVVDNQFVTILATAGLIGVIAFSIFLITLAGRVRRSSTGLALLVLLTIIVATFDYVKWPVLVLPLNIAFGFYCAQLDARRSLDGEIDQGLGGATHVPG